MGIRYEDVYGKNLGAGRHLARLRWAVHFAFAPWAQLSGAEKVELHTGLLAFVPDLVRWERDSSGEWIARAWSDHDVGALQSRLQVMFSAVVDGRESVVLMTYPLRLTWRPPPSVEARSGDEVIAHWVKHDVVTPLPDVADVAGRYREGESPSVIASHIGGLNGVELAVLLTSLLLREFPDRIMRCVAPRAKRERVGAMACGVIFCARPDQKWCTLACAQRGKRMAHEAPAPKECVRRDVPRRRRATG